MARRVKGGMSYVEVLGAILIVSLIGTVVLGAVSLSSHLGQITRRTKVATARAEAVMTGLVVALESVTWQTLQEMTDLETLLGAYATTWLVDEQLSYTLSLWPVTVSAGSSWRFDHEAPPVLTLRSGAGDLVGGRAMQVSLPRKASYAFDTGQYSGQFIDAAYPREVLGELHAQLTKEGTYYHTQILKGSVSGGAKLEAESLLSDQQVTLTIKRYGSGGDTRRTVTCIVDGSLLTPEAVAGLRLRVIQESGTKVLLKLVGDPELMSQITLERVQTEGVLDVVYQPERVGCDYYVAVLDVGDETGRIAKRLMNLVGIAKGGSQDES